MPDAPAHTSHPPPAAAPATAHAPEAARSRQPRPEFRNIGLQEVTGYLFRMPLAGWVSILHRVSGALLFLFGIPTVLYLLQDSLRSEVGFNRYQAILASVPVKLLLLVLIWALVHHLIAGIRFLLLDIGIGVAKPASALGAKIVLLSSLSLTALLALALFLF